MVRQPPRDPMAGVPAEAEIEEEEVEEENSAKKGGLHLRGADGGELNVEAVAVGEELLAHVGGGLRDGPHILAFHVSDDKIGLRRTQSNF